LAARSAVDPCKGEAQVDGAIEVTKESADVLVLSFGASWCGPCKALDPKVAALSETFAGRAQFIKIVGDKDPDGSKIMRREGVRALPEYHIFKDGEKVEVIKGVQYDQLVKSLQKYARPSDGKDPPDGASPSDEASPLDSIGAFFQGFR